MNTSKEYLNFCNITGATDEDLEWFEKFSFWIEGIFQLGLGRLSIYYQFFYYLDTYLVHIYT